MSEPTPPDAGELSFVTTEDLIAELMRRHDAILIVREVKAPATSEQNDTFYDYDGGVSRCIGLAFRAIARLTGFAQPADTHDKNL